MRWRTSAAAAVVGALLAASPAPAALGARSRVAITVRPSTGSPHTAFVVSFRAPATGALGGSMIRSYEVSAVGTAGKGCVASAVAPAGSARAGKLVRVTLRLGAGHQWCIGNYEGRLDETIRPRCGPAQACPQFIAVVVVGTFRFKVA